MKQKEFLWHIICYDDYHLEEKQELLDFLECDYLQEILRSFDQNIIVVLGWDGTMLRAIKENHKKWLPFLGINFGHKWFLLNAPDFILPNIEYNIRPYPLLEVEVEMNGEIKKSIAVNEIDIRAGNGKMISLDISVSGRQSINIEGDGIIISTPAGSTGYNSSLGGPIIPHTLWAFVLTPKAPWKPKGQTPVLINDNETIQIKNVGRRLFTEIYCDGKEFLITQNDIQTNFTIQKSTQFVSLLIAKAYQNTWDNKVLQEQGFQTK